MAACPTCNTQIAFGELACPYCGRQVTESGPEIEGLANEVSSESANTNDSSENQSRSNPFAPPGQSGWNPPNQPPAGGYNTPPPFTPGYGYPNMPFQGASMPPQGPIPPYPYGSPYGYPYGQMPLPTSTCGLAIASLVCGVLWLYWAGAILAIIFGIVALGQISRSNGRLQGRGLAIAGIVLGTIELLIAIFLIIVIIIAAHATQINQPGSSGSGNSPSPTYPPSNPTTSVAPSLLPPGGYSPVPASNACPPSISNVARKTVFSSAPPMLIDTTKTYYANFQTDVGDFKIALDPAQSPVTVNNFVFLSCYHYYDGTIFHRVIPDFMNQGGDPNGNPPGMGGPGYTIPDEYPKGSQNSSPYAAGQIAMANTGAGNSGGSQFFIVASADGANTLDKDIDVPGAEPYTIFGSLVNGMDTVLKINNDGSASGTPKVTHKLEQVTITSS